MENVGVGIAFIVLGGAHVLWPKEAFKYRAWIYKKFYGASVKGTKRTWKTYRIMGLLFILVGIAFLI